MLIWLCSGGSLCHAVVLDLQAFVDAHGLALHGHPEVIRELGVPAGAVRVAPGLPAGPGEFDLQLQLPSLGEHGVPGLPAVPVHVPDYQHLGHVAHGHAVLAVGVGGVRLGLSHAG